MQFFTAYSSIQFDGADLLVIYQVQFSSAVVNHFTLSYTVFTSHF